MKPEVSQHNSTTGNRRDIFDFDHNFASQPTPPRNASRILTNQYQKGTRLNNTIHIFFSIFRLSKTVTYIFRCTTSNFQSKHVRVNSNNSAISLLSSLKLTKSHLKTTLHLHGLLSPILHQLDTISELDLSASS